MRRVRSSLVGQQATDAADAAARLGEQRGETPVGGLWRYCGRLAALAGLSRIAGIAISNQRETATAGVAFQRPAYRACL